MFIEEVPAVGCLFLLWTFFAEEKGEQGEVFVAVDVHMHMYCWELKKLHWNVKLLSVKKKKVK